MARRAAALAIADVMLIGCSSSEGSGSDSDSLPSSGTWVNEATSVKMVVIEDNGDFRAYSDLDGTALYREGTCTVVEEWTDDSGDYWAETDCVDTNDTTWYSLARVSAGGSVWEMASAYDDYPDSDEPVWEDRYERADP